MRIRWVGLLLAAALTVPACSGSGSAGEAVGATPGGPRTLEADGRAIPGGPGPGGPGPSPAPEEVWSSDVVCVSYSCSAFADDDGLFLRSGEPDALALTALDPETGKQRWRRVWQGRADASLVGPYLVVIAQSTSTTVEVVDRATGKAAWERRLEGSIAPTGIATEGLVLIGTTGSRHQRKVLALDAKTGKQRWSADGVAGAMCGEDAVILGDGGVRAVDAATGEQRWSRAADGDWRAVRATCTTDGDIIVKADRDGKDRVEPRVRRYRSEDGSVRWTAAFASDGELGIDRSGDTVVLSGLDQMRGLDAGSGKVRWTLPIDHDAGTPLLYARGGSFVVRMTDQSLVSFDPKTGEPQGKREIARDEYPLLWADATILVRKGKVIAYEHADLSVRWTITAPGAATAALGGGQVYVVTPKGVTAYA